MSQTAIAERGPTAAAIEQVLIKGDLSALSDAQRLTHYKNVCESLGLNPLTTPFDYLKLNGKTVLYAKRDATEQLRKLHGVSIIELTTQHFQDVYIVVAKAQDRTGRTDASTGVVPLGSLKGEALANALMKAETKAKRRVTLSICGLGMLDETEVDSIQAQVTAVAQAPDPPAQLLDTTTGEVVPTSAHPEPPEGFSYIEDFRMVTGWFHVYRTLPNGARLDVSTKKEQVGEVLRQAYQDGLPVNLTLSKNGKYIDAVEVWKPLVAAPATGEPLTDDLIPF